MSKLILCLCSVVYLNFISGARAFATPQVWFGGVDTVTAKTILESKTTDFGQLFDENSEWPVSSSHLDVFKISMQFAIAGSEQDIRRMVSFLRQKHIALAIEMGMLRADKGCGRGEGYMPKETLHTAMSRLKRLGADVAYVMADEVVFFGKYNQFPSSKLPPCHDEVDEIAREVVETMTLVTNFFPRAEFGFGEPIGGQRDRLGKPVIADQDALLRDYLRFADLYKQLTNKKISFFQADVAWRSQGWKPYLSKLKGGMQSRGIRFGIIIGGNPDFKDDMSWTEAGLNLLVDLYSNPAISPGYIIIQSWQPNPTHYLPENQKGTATWMLLQAEKIAAQAAERYANR